VSSTLAGNEADRDHFHNFCPIRNALLLGSMRILENLLTETA
jgi:hypothetical protein